MMCYMVGLDVQMSPIAAVVLVALSTAFAMIVIFMVAVLVGMKTAKTQNYGHDEPMDSSVPSVETSWGPTAQGGATAA